MLVPLLRRNGTNQITHVLTCFQLLSALFVCVLTCAAQPSCSNKRIFAGEEDPCLDSAPAPSALVINAILNTKEISETVASMTPSERTDVSKLLKGLTIHLHNQQQKDMVVRGDYPMSGADNTWFWVVISADNQPSAFWFQANVVTILRSRHYGYADIRTDWAAGSNIATRIFRYDGHRYKLSHEKYDKLPPR